jgi:hypothetical protein
VAVMIDVRGRWTVVPSAERARRTLHGIDEQISKAEKAVAGKTPVKRNRFVQLAGGRSTGRWKPKLGLWPG